MPPRRVKEEPQNDGINLMLSQVSNASSSDDNAAFEMAKSIKASVDKKKKEHQQKFLVAIKNHIMKEISGSVEEFNAAVQAIDVLLQAFLINYAAEEDNIRKIWCEIIDEERALQTFIEKCRSDNVNTRESGEALRVKGMAKIRTVCQEHRRVADFVNPT